MGTVAVDVAVEGVPETVGGMMMTPASVGMGVQVAVAGKGVGVCVTAACASTENLATITTPKATKSPITNSPPITATIHGARCRNVDGSSDATAELLADGGSE
jgi:hypothetical protein